MTVIIALLIHIFTLLLRHYYVLFPVITTIMERYYLLLLY